MFFFFGVFLLFFFFFVFLEKQAKTHLFWQPGWRWPRVDRRSGVRFPRPASGDVNNSTSHRGQEPERTESRHCAGGRARYETTDRDRRAWLMVANAGSTAGGCFSQVHRRKSPSEQEKCSVTN